MAWADYRREWMDGADEVEAEVDKTWAAVLALILLRESALKRAAMRRLGSVAEREGRWTFQSPRVGRALRSGVLRDANGFISDLTADVSAQVRVSMRRAEELWRRSYERSSAVLEKDLERNRSRPKEQRTEVTEAALRARRAGGLRKHLSKARSSMDEEDWLELREDAYRNIARWIREGGWKFHEEIARTTNRYGRSEDTYQLILGGDGSDKRRTVDQGNGWALNRNNMRLSTTAHLRAVFRRGTMSAADSLGVDSLAVWPTRRGASRFATGGLLGPHLYRVRKVPEWQAAIGSVNRSRRTSSTIDTMGFGYGDSSYLLLVPSIYLAAAVAESRRNRERWEQSSRTFRRSA